MSYGVHMETVGRSVRITADAQIALAKLSAKLGKSKAQVIQTALQQLEDRVFWAEVHDAFARNFPNAERTAETSLWERAADNDFQDETW